MVTTELADMSVLRDVPYEPGAAEEGAAAGGRAGRCFPSLPRPAWQAVPAAGGSRRRTAARPWSGTANPGPEDPHHDGGQNVCTNLSNKSTNTRADYALPPTSGVPRVHPTGGRTGRSCRDV